MKKGARTLPPTVLVGTDFGHSLLCAMGGCWLFRLVLQPMYRGRGRPSWRVMAVVFAAGAVLHFGVWMAANAIRGVIEAPPPKGRQGWKTGSRSKADATGGRSRCSGSASDWFGVV